MLNQSNRNVPTRRVEFQNVQLEVTQRLKDDHSNVQTFRLRTSAELNEKLDDAWALSRADWEGNPWEVLSASVLNSFIDSTDQFVF